MFLLLPLSLPTTAPTALPTLPPTPIPTPAPTPLVTLPPVSLPTAAPTSAPVAVPTPEPTPLITLPPSLLSMPEQHEHHTSRRLLQVSALQGTCDPFDATLPLCSGHGECVVTNGTHQHCACHEQYNGTACEQDLGCGGHCPLHAGSCRQGVCVCGLAYIGVNCTVDACAFTGGGAALDRDTCNCTAVGTQYPDLVHDNWPWTSFRGCRKLCPRALDPSRTAQPFYGHECGTFRSGVNAVGQRINVTRCGPIVAANDTVTNVTCNCTSAYQPYQGTDVHPVTGNQAHFTLSTGGLCLPLCWHCNEDLGTQTCLPDNCTVTPCQWQGPQCAASRCPGSPESFWNGTQCLCAPEWLYPSTSVCNETEHLCGPAPYGQPPDFTTDHTAAAHTCNCSYPYEVDLNTTSPTYRLCVGACGPPERGQPVGGTCVCTPPYTGLRCRDHLCAWPFEPWPDPRDGVETVCDCLNRTQWGGRYCNESLCGVGGVPLTGAQADGCTCTGLYTGPTCALHHCAHGGTPHSPTASTCDCAPGWFGSLCTVNGCGATQDALPHADPTTATGFRCDCEAAGTYSLALGCLPDCGVHGTPTPGLNGSLYCRCDDEWFTTDPAAPCAHHPCANPTKHYPLDLSDSASDCACRPEYVGTDADDVRCGGPETCQDFLDRHPVAAAGDGYLLRGVPARWHPSTVAVPVANPAYDADPTGEHPCVCHDSRYRLQSTVSGLFLGCVLLCDRQRGTFVDDTADLYAGTNGTTALPAGTVFELYADACPCDTDPTGVWSGHGGTHCTGVYVAGQVVGYPVGFEAGGSGALPGWGWALLVGVTALLAVGWAMATHNLQFGSPPVVEDVEDDGL